MQLNRKRDDEEGSCGAAQRLDLLAAGLKAVLLLLVVVVALGGCGGKKELVGDPVDAYMTVIKALEDPKLFNQDNRLNYIAVDTRNMTGIADKEDQERLLTELADTYEVEILVKNQVQLARHGYLEENRFEDGILFKISEANYSKYDESPVLINVQEWGRGTDTLLHKQFTLEAEKGKWKITEVEDVTERKLS